MRIVSLLKGEKQVEDLKYPLALLVLIYTYLMNKKINDELKKYVEEHHKLFCITLVVSHGLANGRKLGFPTANQIPTEGMAILPNGVYKTFAVVNGTIYHSMTNIGIHPTISPLNKPILETTILDGFSQDLYGQTLSIYFELLLREEIKFSSLDLLIKQLEEDKKNCEKGIIPYNLIKE